MSPAPLVTFAIAYSPAPPGPWGYSSYLCVHQPDHDSLCLQKTHSIPQFFLSRIGVKLLLYLHISMLRTHRLYQKLGRARAFGRVQRQIPFLVA